MKQFLSLVLAAIVLLGSVNLARADESGGDAGSLLRIQKAVQQGIWGLSPLLIAAAALMALHIQRLWAYQQRKLFPQPLVDELTTVALGMIPDRERLARLVEAHASLLANLVRGVLRTAKCSVLERNQLAEDMAAAEMGEIGQLNSYYDVFYSASTLVGLLGALYGLIQAFSRQAESAEGMSNAIVTAAVAPALIATAGGVLLAVFARVLGEIIKGLHEKRKRQVKKFLRPLIILLAPPPAPKRSRNKPLPPAKPPAQSEKLDRDVVEPKSPQQEQVIRAENGTPAPSSPRETITPRSGTATPVPVHPSNGAVPVQTLKAIPPTKTEEAMSPKPDPKPESPMPPAEPRESPPSNALSIRQTTEQHGRPHQAGFFTNGKANRTKSRRGKNRNS